MMERDREENDEEREIRLDILRACRHFNACEAPVSSRAIMSCHPDAWFSS